MIGFKSTKKKCFDSQGDSWMSKAVITVFPLSLVNHSVSSILKCVSDNCIGMDGEDILYDPGWTSSSKAT